MATTPSFSFGTTPALPNVFGNTGGATTASVASKPVTPSFNFATTPAPFNVVPTGNGTFGPAPVNFSALNLNSGGTPALPNLTALGGATPQTDASDILSTPYVTTPSGAVVDPNTGALISAPGGNASIGSYNGSGSSLTQPVMPSTYGSATSGLLGYGSNINPSTASAASGLLGIGSSNPATSGAALPAYDQAVSNLQNFETNLQTQLGNTGSQPIPMPFIQGQQQVINTQNAGILDALQGAVNQYQTAVGLGVQGAGVQAGALNEAGNIGTTAQEAEQGALGTAGQLTQPVANATYFGTPETGGLVGNSLSGPMAQYAQMAANGQYDAIPSTITSNPVLSAQLNQMASAINPNYSPVTSSAESEATASNVGTAETATPQAANSVYQQAYGQYQTLQQAVNNVGQFGSLLTSGMTSSDGTVINPSSDQYANMTIAQFRQQLSNPSQAQFDSTLASLQSKVSGMLSVGGSQTPTELTNDANSIINGTAPIGTLNATLARIQDEGNIMLNNQAQVVNNAKSNITAPGTNLGTTGGGSTSGAPAGWNW